jgi:hypothetical protein
MFKLENAKVFLEFWKMFGVFLALGSRFAFNHLHVTDFDRNPRIFSKGA